MKEKLVDALVNLTKIASIMSLAGTLVFVVKALNNSLETEYIKEIIMIIFIFYFGSKSGEQKAQAYLEKLQAQRKQDEFDPAPVEAQKELAQ